MQPFDADSRLSQISTVWTMVYQAHQDETDEAISARNELMQKYHGAAYRYLLGALGNPDDADEAFQDFALRFARGAFRRADPGRGRFRQFVKTTLINLIIDYRKKRVSRGLSLDAVERHATKGTVQPADLESEFIVSWRTELISRAWQSLETAERNGNQPFYSVLRFKAENPEESSDEMAQRLTARLCPRQPWTAAGIRKLLQRARQKFAELLIQDVRDSMEGPTRERLEEELAELGLLPYCRCALDPVRAHGSDKGEPQFSTRDKKSEN